MNISTILKKKVTKVIVIITFTIISITTFYFIFIKNQEEGVWFSENWSYRKALFLDIPSKYYNFEQDILVEIDTETLISEGKMENDCRDIRFVDEDNRTRLKYWIEGGCNTKNTQIWIKMRLPEASQKTVYLYYGNKLAPDAQEQWGGHFITLSLEDCKKIWGLDSSFQGKTPLGSTEYGEIVESEYKLDEILESGDSPTCKNSAHILNEPVTEKCNLEEDNILINSLISSLDLEKYVPVNFCQSTNGYLNSTSISMIETETPNAWKHVSEIDNKFPVGRDDITTVELANEESVICKNTTLENETGTETYIKLENLHTQYFIQTEPPSYTLNFISPTNDSPMITGLIILASKLPPMGWEIYEEISDLFLKGSENTKLVTGGADINSQDIYLNFTPEKTTINNLRRIETKEICLDDFGDNKIELNIYPTPPPYIKVLFIKRKGTNIATSIDVASIIQNNKENIPTPTPITTDSKTDVNIDDTIKIKIKIDDEEKKDDIIDNGEVLGASTPTTPDGLLVEGETNPTTVSDPTPEFSAIYNDPDTEDSSSNYQINVNTSSDFTGTVMWDSGKMTMTTTNEGERSPDISYNGSTLSEGTTYYWRIKFWDSDNNESPWSSTANFSLSYAPIASELLTCGNSNPSYITDNLTFSAIYTDPGNTNSTYYEIEVNTASNFSGTVMWDTGKTSTTIASDTRSSDFVYSGTPLTHDGTTYYIRMRFWDSTDTVSDWVTGQFVDVIKSFRLNDLNLDGIKMD